MEVWDRIADPSGSKIVMVWLVWLWWWWISETLWSSLWLLEECRNVRSCHEPFRKHCLKGDTVNDRNHSFRGGRESNFKFLMRMGLVTSHTCNALDRFYTLFGIRDERKRFSQIPRDWDNWSKTRPRTVLEIPFERIGNHFKALLPPHFLLLYLRFDDS